MSTHAEVQDAVHELILEVASATLALAMEMSPYSSLPWAMRRDVGEKILRATIEASRGDPTAPYERLCPSPVSLVSWCNEHGKVVGARCWECQP